MSASLSITGAASLPSTPTSRSVWRELHDNDPYALPTQSPDWIDALTSTARYRDVTRIYRLPDGRTAVLPLVARVGAGPLGAAQSMPTSWGYGGLINSGTLDDELVTAVLDDVTSAPGARFHVRPNPLHAEIWANAVRGRPFVTASRVHAHILDLEGGFDTVWGERFTSTARTNTRKAEKAGVRVETDATGALIEVFYGLWQQSIDRWAAKQNEPLWLARLRGGRRDPIGKLHSIARHLGERCQVSVAWLDDRPAAAIIVLTSGTSAHYTRGAMDEELAGPSRANALLHTRAIEAACQRGCRYYHMGETGSSPGLAQFKTRFGARGYDYAEYWIEQLPIHRTNTALRAGIKRMIGFRDV